MNKSESDSENDIFIYAETNDFLSQASDDEYEEENTSLKVNYPQREGSISKRFGFQNSSDSVANSFILIPIPKI